MALAANAQETTTKTKTTSSGGPAQTVTYTGCVQTGTQTSSYVLNKVVPVTKTTTVEGPAGSTTTTSTSYVLVPGERVQLQENVGHKVEVTGTLVPAGDTKTETRTEVEREGKDSRTRERVETKNAPAQFRVTSIKSLGDKCD
jgi:hypothetical protein